MLIIRVSIMAPMEARVSMAAEPSNRFWSPDYSLTVPF